jgi:hypothetical protein
VGLPVYSIFLTSAEYALRVSQICNATFVCIYSLESKLLDNCDVLSFLPRLRDMNELTGPKLS